VLTTSSSAIGLPFGDQVAPTEAHLEFMDGHRKSAYDAHHRAEAFILPQLGDIEVSALTTERIRKWHIALAQAPARMRSPKNGKQRYRQLGKDADSIRRRQASANRNLTQLKAALNAAWRDGRTPSDAAWRRVRPFPGADAVFDARGMSPPDQCQPSGVPAAGTGCAYNRSPIWRALPPPSPRFRPRLWHGRHPDQQDRPAETHHSDQRGGCAISRALRRPRLGRDLGSEAGRPTVGNVESGRADARGMRHTWASLAVMAGMPLMVVAKNLGHRDTRMVEAHYGHMAPSYVAEAVRKHAPKFGFKPSKVVTPLR